MQRGTKRRSQDKRRREGLKGRWITWQAAHAIAAATRPLGGGHGTLGITSGARLMNQTKYWAVQTWGRERGRGRGRREKDWQKPVPEARESPRQKGNKAVLLLPQQTLFSATNASVCSSRQPGGSQCRQAARDSWTSSCTAEAQAATSGSTGPSAAAAADAAPTADPP